jgi:hypothetical protein
MVEQVLGETAEGQSKPRWKWVPHLRRSREKCRWHKEMKRYLTVLLLFLSVLLFVCPFSVGGKIYKWVDEKGVVHFSVRVLNQPTRLKGYPGEGFHGAFQPLGRYLLKASARTPIAHAVNCTFTIKWR